MNTRTLVGSPWDPRPRPQCSAWRNTTTWSRQARAQVPAFSGIHLQRSSVAVANRRATSYNAAPMAKQKKHPSGTIALNKKALHDFFIEQKFEAGLALAGWEVKSLRA